MKVKTKRKKYQLDYIILYLILIIAAGATIIPIGIAVLYSIRPTGEYAALPIWIDKATLEHYRIILFEKDFIQYVYRSLVVALSSIIISLIVGIPAAYGFARFKFPAGNFLTNWILSTWMIPPIVAVVPIFLIIIRIGMFDKLLTLSVLYSVFNLPLVVWIMREFFRQIPQEIEEAAMLEGCSTLGILLRIFLPLSKTGLISTMILCFIFSWNEFLFALVFTGPFARTMPVGTLETITPFGILWGELFAILSIMIIPSIIFVSLTRKYLIKGFTSFGSYY